MVSSALVRFSTIDRLGTRVLTRWELAEKEKGADEQIETRYKQGYGTVLFFEDQSVVHEWCGKIPSFAQVTRSTPGQSPSFYMLIRSIA